MKKSVTNELRFNKFANEIMLWYNVFVKEKIMDNNLNKKRDNYISWEEYFMSIAKLSAMRSKDPSTRGWSMYCK